MTATEDAAPAAPAGTTGTGRARSSTGRSTRAGTTTTSTAPSGSTQVRRPRAAVLALLLVAAVVVTGTGRALEVWPFSPRNVTVALSSAGISVAPDGTRTPIPPGSDVEFLPGSRVAVAAPGTATQEQLDAAQESRDWLAAGTVPGTGTDFEDMAVDALLDIRALTLDDGAVVAGWSPNWRYAWPRDNAFVAVALARTGHLDDAIAVVKFLQQVQEPDGSFEARYLPDGSGPPDDRGIQTDATGWALWAAATVIAEIDSPRDRRQAARDLEPLLERSVAHIRDLTADGTELPPPSPDYWEVETSQQTLGTSAPLLMALAAAPPALDALGDAGAAREVEAVASTFADVVHDEFAPGYGRYRGGSSVDTAVAFLLPPFQPVTAAEVPRAVLTAWEEAPVRMARPAGGLAPGTSWKRDGISWTPTTSVFALASAGMGDETGAVRWLTWLDDHRTTLGSIPEKVLFDGSPAQLAPLAWSSANVLLTLALLDDAAAGSG